MILLDSNTLIHYLKGREPVVTRLQKASPRDIAIPSIVAYELEYGSARVSPSRRHDVVSRLLAELDQIPFDGPAATESARIRIELEKAGRMIGPMDLLIAGTARSRGAVLVTNNTREFSRVKGLRIEDWTK